VRNQLDEGREALMRETLKNDKGLKELCPELKELEKLVCEAVAGL
jgi:hypothetical protein